MKSTDGNADPIWPKVGLPKHRRPACRAKMRPNLSPLLPVADIDVGRSFGANMFLLEKGTHAEHRTGSPLALATMAGAYNIRIRGYFDAQGTTRAMRSSSHSAPSLSRCSETTGGRLSERPNSLAIAYERRTRHHDGPVRFSSWNISRTPSRRPCSSAFRPTLGGTPTETPSSSASVSANMRARYGFPGGCSKSCSQRPPCLNAALKPTIFIGRGSTHRRAEGSS